MKSVLLCLALTCTAVCQRGQIPDDISVERDVEYGKGGESPLKLDIYRPKNLASKPMAAVICIHGGGWRGGDKSKAGPISALTKAGFIVFSINYRLSGEAPFPAAVEDCKCAVRWVRANAKTYDVDEERIGVWGSSAGGHLALFVGCVGEKEGFEGNGGNDGVSSRVKAVVSWFGPADFTVGSEKFEDGRGAAVSQFLGGKLSDRKDVYEKASPATHASKDDPPVLMIHGDKDSTVPIEQSEIMEKKLKSIGVDATLMRVKNAGHGFGPSGGKVEPSMDEINKSTIEFFKKHLAK